ncbi:GlxA family transcriptional regulator [Tahibacter amnicola]|uniref:Helix-turn-helix domain-containing protein n=1 Tax=Tahibacter amnicola TaxID=2976241 RepID=A0ABY6BDS5_9GAMM|nr:helix-turn-helix domain-containing protein [Tahibacter amnicola]UXI67741.1 helix-turn-helix domain-containing protein [Tahibacter amnicola]
MTAPSPRVVTVCVVLPPRALLLDIAGPVEVLRQANREQSAVRFDVSYAGPQATVMSSIALPLAGIGPLPSQLPVDAVILVTGNVSQLGFDATSDRAQDLRDESVIVEWLRRNATGSRRVICICSGALLAARAGLMDGRSCTTHFSCQDQLAALAPASRPQANRLFVEDGPIWSSAGVTAGIDLMLHFVTREAGSACAQAVARELVVYLRRAGADPQFSPWLTGRNHIHPVIHRVQDAIAQAPQRRWTLGELARHGRTSARHLSRLFNEHAGMGLPEYINRLRVGVAKELLANTRLDIDRVAEHSGFASARQLRRAWSLSESGSPRSARGNSSP